MEQSVVPTNVQWKETELQVCLAARAPSAWGEPQLVKPPTRCPRSGGQGDQGAGHGVHLGPLPAASVAELAEQPSAPMGPVDL